MDDLVGEVRIGIYTHIGRIILPKIIAKFTKRYPHVKFVIMCSSKAETITDLKNNELDLIMLRYSIFPGDDTFKEKILFTSESCFFAKKDIYDSIISGNKKLDDYPILVPNKNTHSFRTLEDIFKKNNMILSPMVNSFATELNVELALEGIGIGWCIKRYVMPEFEKQNLYEIPVDFKLPELSYSIAYREKYLNNTTKKFIEWLFMTAKDSNILDDSKKSDNSLEQDEIDRENYDPFNFEEEDLEDDDYYFEDEDNLEEDDE